jgi:hypothetical protein
MPQRGWFLCQATTGGAGGDRTHCLHLVNRVARPRARHVRRILFGRAEDPQESPGRSRSTKACTCWNSPVGNGLEPVVAGEDIAGHTEAGHVPDVPRDDHLSVTRSAPSRAFPSTTTASTRAGQRPGPCRDPSPGVPVVGRGDGPAGDGVPLWRVGSPQAIVEVAASLSTSAPLCERSGSELLRSEAVPRWPGGGCLTGPIQPASLPAGRTLPFRGRPLAKSAGAVTALLA